MDCSGDLESVLFSVWILSSSSVFSFKEKEGKTFVLARSLVETLGYQFEYPCRMITLNVHSSLSAVGEWFVTDILIWDEPENYIEVSSPSYCVTWPTMEYLATWPQPSTTTISLSRQGRRTGWWASSPNSPSQSTTPLMKTSKMMMT